MFNSIFQANESVSNIGVREYLICMAAALLMGLFIAALYMIRNTYTKGFVITLAIIPVIVASIIIMVNGNLGVGVAVAGAFSLVRFRSAQGTAKEIGSIFLSMAVGLTLGMGFIGYGILLTVIVSLAALFYSTSSFGEKKTDPAKKVLKITIPEELDYTTVFDDLFAAYTEKTELASVKTTNMGSMFKLTYNITMKDVSKEKKLIDEIRCRNGNLEVICSKVSTEIEEVL